MHALWAVYVNLNNLIHVIQQVHVNKLIENFLS